MKLPEFLCSFAFVIVSIDYTMKMKTHFTLPIQMISLYISSLIRQRISCASLMHCATNANEYILCVFFIIINQFPSIFFMYAAILICNKNSQT